MFSLKITTLIIISLFAYTEALFDVKCSKLKYYLYDCTNNTFCQFFPDDRGESIRTCGFKDDLSTIMHIDGWLQSGVNGIVSRAVIAGVIASNQKCSYNLVFIAVDEYSLNLVVEVYVAQSYKIGRCIAKNLFFYFEKYVVPMNKCTIFAFSQGTTISAIAINISPYKPYKFAVFDVPFFNTYKFPKGSNQTFTIQTICSRVGILYSIGDATYVLNNAAINQPQCNCIESIPFVCSHAICGQLIGLTYQNKTIFATKVSTLPEAYINSSSGKRTPYLHPNQRGFFHLNVLDNQGLMDTPCSPTPDNNNKTTGLVEKLLNIVF